MDPISGSVSGHLAILLALGSPDQVSAAIGDVISDVYIVQVSYLLQQHASGSYPIQPGSLHSQNKAEGTSLWDRRSLMGGKGSRKRDTDAKEDPRGSLAHHQFTIQIEGIRALEVAANTVWGEADCFIQYHFPAPLEDNDSSQIGESVYGLTVSCDCLAPPPRVLSSSHPHHPLHAQPFFLAHHHPPHLPAS